MTEKKRFSFFGTTPLYTEDLFAGELTDLEISDISITHGGVEFSTDLEQAYRVCLWSRFANRILLILDTFEIRTPQDIYDKAFGFPWEEHFNSDSSISVDRAFSGFSGCTPDYGALLIKDGVCDRFRERENHRPTVDPETPDIRLNLFIKYNRAQFSLDLSGENLFKRGYREQKGAAPLKENVAAAILTRSGWCRTFPETRPFIDPFCGSGTLLIEAAWMASDTAPGLLRQETEPDLFGFTRWKQHQAKLWEALVNEAAARRTQGRKALTAMYGFDIDGSVLATARNNLQRAGLEADISLERRDIQRFKRPARIPEETPGLLVTNPPYGVRLETATEAVPLYEELGKALRHELGGWQAAVFSGNADLLRSVGLKPDRDYKLNNGTLECRLNRYTLFTRKKREELAQKAETLSEGATMFINRLRKNGKLLRKWLAKNNITCYRLYDADMPEYAAAVDIYHLESTHAEKEAALERYAVVQEYAPPPTIERGKAAGRLKEILTGVKIYLEVPSNHVILKQRRQQKGRSQYRRYDRSSKAKSDTIEGIAIEEGLRIQLNLTDYLDVGLFLDSRPLRRLIREASKGRGFLNLFAYTGSATVAAAAGGAAFSVSVDTSATYLDWARVNMRLNGFDGDNHRFIKEDSLTYLKEERKSFGLIYLDPPTFSNSKSRESDFDLQRDHKELINMALNRLDPDGILIFCCNYRRFRIDETLLEECHTKEIVVKDITAPTLDPDFQRNRIHKAWSFSKPPEENS